MIWINDGIMMILAFFLGVGALDYCLGNRFGLGESFHRGLMTMGSVALAMIGIITLAPIAANLLIPIVSPLYLLIGADPASFANTILALDMGGYALAEAMAHDTEAGVFSWVFLGTMLGPTIVFTLPVALSIIKKEDYSSFSKGILIGLSTIPIGCFVGGALAGFEFQMMILNLLIPTLFSLVIMIGLWKKPEWWIRRFVTFGKLVQVVGVIGLVIAGVEVLTGIRIFQEMAPYSEGLQIVGTIALVLGGAFPLVECISKVFRKPLERSGRLIGLDRFAMAGLVAALAHVIPAFTLLGDMQTKGKVVVVAFSVSGAFVIGGHLGFVAGIDRDMVPYMMIGKLIGGLTAIALALWFERKKSVYNG